MTPHDPGGTAADAAGEERDFLLRSLADLERERAAGDIDEHDYQVLKDDYTARAARALRGAAEPVAAGLASVAGGAGGSRRRLRGVLVGVAVAVFAVGSGVAVSRVAGQRAPGGSLTGGVAPSRQAEIDSLLAESREALASSPLDAIKVLDRVLALDPAQPEALTYRGWILYQAGLAEQAVVWLDKAVAADPTYPDARVFRGIVRLRAEDDAAGSVADLEEFLKLAPDHPMAPVVKQTLAEAQAQVREAVKG